MKQDHIIRCYNNASPWKWMIQWDKTTFNGASSWKSMIQWYTSMLRWYNDAIPWKWMIPWYISMQIDDTMMQVHKNLMIKWCQFMKIDDTMRQDHIKRWNNDVSMKKRMAQWYKSMKMDDTMMNIHTNRWYNDASSWKCNCFTRVITFVISFLHSCTPSSFESGFYSKRKEFALKGSNVFPFRVDPFSEGSKDNFDSNLPLKEYLVSINGLDSFWHHQYH